jgi:asparagine synthase (glutamine-hydrolysing)
MCGIAGIFNSQRKQIPFVIKKMTDALQHRGPDAEGFYEEKEIIALGHRRLAIIDLSEGGKQPMSDATGRFWITFNGEIFNYCSVKTQLLDYPFHSQSDTEVIIAAYVKWGVDCVKHLKGQFAFAIWDKKEQTLFLARDRMGEKPLYYYHNEGVFVFASEIGALLQSGLVPKKLSLTGVVDYLKYQSVNSPETILEGVFQIPAASRAVVSSGKLAIDLYWDIKKPHFTEGGYENYDTIKYNVRDLLRNAVTSQMMSDVPLGGFLSGGIDSSAIVGLMAESSSKPIHTFSVIFDDPEFDESVHSNLIAKKFNTEHHAIRLNPSILIDRMPDALKQMDAPSGDGLNTYIIAGLAKKQGIAVALSGLGGDDLFAGYPSFLNYYRLQNKQELWQIPHIIRKLIATGYRIAKPSSKNQKFADLIGLPDTSLKNIYPLVRRVFSTSEIAYLAPQLVADSDYLRTHMALWKNDIQDLPVLSQYAVAELMGYTSNVLLKDSDCMGMAHSLEIRVPFFDPDLIEYVLGIPDALKYPTTPKKLLVDALFPLLPPAIVNRPKMGFSFPWDEWLRKELKDFVTSSIESLAQRGIFDKMRLLRYYEEFQYRNPKILWSRIWLLVVLENWLTKYNV